MDYRPDTIVITGLGMASSLGMDAATSCAAARAEITRTCEVNTYRVFNEEEMESESVMGHAVQFFTDGFEGVGRLVRMGVPALEDLISNSKIRDLEFDKTGFRLSLPDVKRTYERLPEEGEEDFFDEETGGKTIDLGGEVSRKLLELLKLDIPLNNQTAFYSGHSGVIQAIHEAIPALKSGKLDCCIIGGLDSLLEEETLEWLDETKRLKTSERPAGLIPGEAGAFIMIERYDIAMKKKSSILALIRSSAVAEEKDNLLTRKPSAGIGLTNAISEALEKAGENNTGLIICDHNGETCRANEWGNALARLTAKWPQLAELPLWYPAVTFGDTCTASSGISICMAVRGFARNYAKTDNVLVWSSSDSEGRGALCLGRYNGLLEG